MSKRRKPKKGAEYFVIHSKGSIESLMWQDTGIDRVLYAVGNCFRTKAEAEAAAEKVKALLLNLHEEQPVTDCNHLPKLTAEVFDRPDCPKWAEYAAVDDDGIACYFSGKPTILPNTPFWARMYPCTPVSFSEKYDASDWKNSVIKRPAKLPDWCKVGEWCFCLDDDGNCKYFNITKIKDNFIYGDDWTIDYHFVKQARIRPYNVEEMKLLMGKVIEKEHNMHIVTGFENVFDNECMVHVNDCLYGANDLRQFTINGKPCGVLEHLNENGEWVE